MTQPPRLEEAVEKRLAEISQVVFDFFYHGGFTDLNDNDDDLAQELTGKLMTKLKPAISQELQAVRRDTIREVLGKIEDDFKFYIDRYEYRGSISPQVAKEQTMTMVRKILEALLKEGE